MRRSSSLAAVAVAFAVVHVAATQNPQQPPVFRAGIDVVQLDVTVLDKQRQPVRGLARSDFTVLEDGQPQSIVAFDAVSIETPPPPPVAWMRDVTPDVSNNSLEETRLFVLVIDDACIPQDQRFIKNAKAAVQQFVDKLGPHDLTAVVFTADNRRTQDFTNDRTKLLATMEKFSPGMAQYLIKPDPRIVPTPPPEFDTPPDDSHFFLSSIATLGSVADYLIAIPHRRKALIWISPGVPVDFEAAAEVRLAGALGLGAKEMARSMLLETDKVFQRAQRANVAIYPIDPTGLGGLEEYIALRNREGFGTGGTASRAASQSFEYMQMAAANTGGHAIVNTDDYGPGLGQIFVETGSYYLIGFKSTNPKAGSMRRLEVKVNRPDVEVRTRNRYETPAAEKSGKPSTVTPLAKAISGLLSVGELPMQVALTPFAIPGKRQAAVAIALKVSQAVPPEAVNSRVTLSTDLLTTAFTATGDDRGFQKHTAKIQLRAGANGVARYEMLSRIDLAPGRYRLRLAAYNEGSGKTGSVFADVIVPSFADEFASMSGVALSVEPGLPSAPREAVASLLPIVPTAEREFLAGDKVTGFVRLYQNGKRSIESARVLFRVTDSRNRVLFEETGTVAIRQFAGGGAPATVGSEVQPGIGRGVMAPAPPARPDPFANSTMRVAEIRFPVPFDRLGPGPHLLTIEATIGATTLRRDVRFTIQ